MGGNPGELGRGGEHGTVQDPQQLGRPGSGDDGPQPIVVSGADYDEAGGSLPARTLSSSLSSVP